MVSVPFLDRATDQLRLREVGFWPAGDGMRLGNHHQVLRVTLQNALHLLDQIVVVGAVKIQIKSLDLIKNVVPNLLILMVQYLR